MTVGHVPEIFHDIQDVPSVAKVAGDAHDAALIKRILHLVAPYIEELRGEIDELRARIDDLRYRS